MNIKKILMISIVLMLLGSYLKVIAGGSESSFKVTVNVVNPCKIGVKDGVKFLYDCPPKMETRAKVINSGL